MNTSNSTVCVCGLQCVAVYSPKVGNASYVHDTVTGVCCSTDGRWVAGNYLNDFVYLFSMEGASTEAPNASAQTAASAEAAGNGASARRAQRSTGPECTRSDQLLVHSLSPLAALNARPSLNHSLR